jgi:hypothetical protein
MRVARSPVHGRSVEGAIAMRTLTVICLLVSLSGWASAECKAPRFHKGLDFSGTDAGSLSVSIEPRDFTIEKLTCLIEHLKKRNPGWKRAGVWIYSSREAAENYVSSDEIPVSMTLWREWARHRHASYYLEPDGTEYFYISPFGDRVVDPMYYWKLDLPLSGRPRCGRIAMLLDRCLIAVVGDTTYPQTALKNAAFGRVTVTGWIERDGSVNRIDVKDADVRPPQFKELLTSAAVENLKTWQFGVSDEATPFQIDYSYVMDTGPVARGQYAGEVTVYPSLPWNIEIRVKAPR